MSIPITRAVFPVAGLGTRFLPATKASPKEMLPVVDKPLIQYAAEEAVAAGMTELIFINGRNKMAIPNHFDKAYELETELERRGKSKTLNVVTDIVPPEVTCIYIRQAEALGLGHAVLCAKSVVGNEPFAVILADDLIDAGDNGCLKQMVDVYNEHQCSVLAVEPVDASETDRYGVVKSTPVAKSSLPTPSRSCWNRSRFLRGSFRESASTAATSSAICRRRWNTHCSILKCGRTLRPICRTCDLCWVNK